MGEKDPDVESNKRRIIRQPPRVPFLWEEQPGIAKKEWKLVDSPPPPFINFVWDETQLLSLSPQQIQPLPPAALISVSGGETGYYDHEANQFDDGGQENPYPNTTPPRVPSRPFKLVGSVPFTWEAKPGTPLSSFSWDMLTEPNILLLLPPDQNNQHQHIPNLDICRLEPLKTSSSSSRPVKFVASVPFSWEEKPGKPFATDQTTSNQRGGGGHGNNNQLFEFDVSFDTNESLTNAVPVPTNPFLSMQQEDKYPQPDTSSDTDSSYETEAASFVGSSLLEWLFPNFPPKVGILESSCKRVPDSPEAGPTDIGYSINGSSFAIRKPKTLGELIMMSRRRSYVRKAAQDQKQNPSMHEFVKRSTFGCWTFGQGLNLKRHLRLKMV